MLEKIQANIGESPVGALATLNEDGSPWNTTLHFAFDNEHVYWLSSDKTQHSLNIERDGRVSIVIWSSDELPNVKGLYIQSRASVVSGEDEVLARQAYAQRFGGEIPEKFQKAATYRAALGEINTTKSRGQLLYTQA